MTNFNMNGVQECVTNIAGTLEGVTNMTQGSEGVTRSEAMRQRAERKMTRRPVTKANIT